MLIASRAKAQHRPQTTTDTQNFGLLAGSRSE